MYAKIFTSIYDGTLGTVGPWEALITFQQMLVLADRFGVCDMTAEAISRRTTIPLDIIKRGIDALERPDDHSRRSDFEGKRIIRLDDHRDWGWQIVNHAHYRSIRSAEERREYQKIYKREARKTLPIAPEGFAEFWQLYPRKVGKGTAERAWLKAVPSQATAEAVINAVKAQAVCDQWNKDDGKFIPHPTTWLNRKGWLDEVPEAVDYGRCHYCVEDAISIKNERPHCAKAQHVDWAKQGAG